MTVDSHVIVRNNTDILCMLSAIFSEGVTQTFTFLFRVGHFTCTHLHVCGFCAIYHTCGFM